MAKKHSSRLLYLPPYGKSIHIFFEIGIYINLSFLIKRLKNTEKYGKITEYVILRVTKEPIWRIKWNQKEAPLRVR